MSPAAASVDDATLERVRKLARSAGAVRVDSIERVDGGRNNRAYRINTDSTSFFLKVYHTDPDDPRPRLRTEIAFLRFAWDTGVRCIPEPLAADHEHGLGLYAFVDGRRLAPTEISRAHIDQAIRFVEALNQGRETAAAAKLPAASEACFSIAAHLDLVDARVHRLGAVEGTDEVGRMAQALVRERLEPLWRSVSQRVRAEATAAGLLDRVLAANERCLSPSDFGFHNAILQPGGRLVFHDFEYAGWDDAAKMICDFLCQPEVPVPEELAAHARDSLLAATPAAPARDRRVELLLPVFRVKWCCICLDDFVPAGARRRAFAGADTAGERRRVQLAKATDLLERADQL